VKRVLLASPRGYCAGVERAVDTVERALQLYGEPVYVRKQIVHNLHVVHELEERGAVFVDTVEEVPEGATVVFSAHGVAPSVREAAAPAQRDGGVDHPAHVDAQAGVRRAHGETVLAVDRLDRPIELRREAGVEKRARGGSVEAADVDAGDPDALGDPAGVGAVPEIGERPACGDGDAADREKETSGDEETTAHAQRCTPLVRRGAIPIPTMA